LTCQLFHACLNEEVFWEKVLASLAIPVRSYLPNERFVKRPLDADEEYDYRDGALVVRMESTLFWQQSAKFKVMALTPVEGVDGFPPDEKKRILKVKVAVRGEGVEGDCFYFGECANGCREGFGFAEFAINGGISEYYVGDFVGDKRQGHGESGQCWGNSTVQKRKGEFENNLQGWEKDEVFFVWGGFFFPQISF
jgi:hypothetical protein